MGYGQHARATGRGDTRADGMGESVHEIEARRKPSGLEKLIGFVSPERAYRRMVFKEHLHEFSAVKRNSSHGKLATQFDQGSSESWKKQRERIDAMWEGREMEENFCIIAGVLQKLGKYIAGQLEYQPETGAGQAINEQYSQYFHDWCGRADYSGRHRFRTLVQLGVASAIRDGDHGWIEHIEKGELRLQAIEGDRIGNPTVQHYDEDNIGGIKIDTKGRVTGYEIYKRSRTALYSLEGEVKPDSFIHLFFPNRTDQYHGVSKLAPALPHARDMYELLGSEKTAAKFAASFAAFVRTKDIGAPGAAQWEESATGSGLPPKFKVQSGTVMKLETGVDDIEFAPGTTRPTNAFMQLWEALIREIALALDLPYGFVYNMAAFGGITARLETQSAQRTFRWYQEVLEHVILNRVKEKVFMLAIANKTLPYVKGWNRGTWRFGPTLTGDAGYQVAADLDLIKSGIKCRSQLSAEYNNNFAETMEKKATEIKTAMDASKKYGVPIEMLLGDLENPTQLLANLERAKKGIPDPAAPPPPPPGLIGSVGDKGVKNLLDLIMSVGKGEVDRDSAINTAMAVYGLPYQETVMLFPKVAPVMVQ